MHEHTECAILVIDINLVLVFFALHGCFIYTLYFENILVTDSDFYNITTIAER